MKKFEKLFVLALLPVMSLSMNNGAGSISAKDNTFAKAVQPLKLGISDITSLDTSKIADLKYLGASSDILNNYDPSILNSNIASTDGLFLVHITGTDIANYMNYETHTYKIFENDGTLITGADCSITSAIYVLYTSSDGFALSDFEPEGPGAKNYTAYNSEWTYDALMTDGATKTIPINYASHYTQEEILELVSAVDLFGQPVDFVVTSSDYVDAIGSYTIVLTATDSYGLTATCTLNIVVLDKSSPIIAKKNDYTADYGATITESDLFACVTASDNSGIDPTLSIQSDGGLNIGGSAIFGTYTVVIKATDGAGNNSTLPITVNVIDETAPVFTKNDGEVGDTVVYGYSETHALTATVLINLFTATDFIDGECPITTDDDINPSVGTHSMILEASDDSGNTATMTVFYEIDADIPPVFILDSSLVQVSSDNPLTKANILSIVQSMIPDDAKYPTLTDETQFSTYLENANVVGSKTTIDYSYVTAAEVVEDGSMIIEVIDEDGDGDGLFDDRNLFEKIGDWFKNTWKSFTTGVSEFGQRIKNLVTWKGWKTDKEVKASDAEVEETTTTSI